MPVAVAGNAFNVGIDRQSGEGTIAFGTADYSMAVYEATIDPVESLNRIEVTDANSIIGDPYKGPQSWTASWSHPAYAASLGAEIQAFCSTDTNTGTASPYSHVFTGMGGTQPWISVYKDFTNASDGAFVFADGLCTSLGFSATREGGPLRVSFAAVGKTAHKVDWTATTADDLTDGYFQLQATGAKIELDVDTADSNPSTQPEKISAFDLTVSRDVTPEPVVDAFAVNTLSQGRVSFTGSMEWLYSSLDAYRSTYFGAVAGTAASSTIVYGALELTAKHSSDANASLAIYVPKVAFRVGNLSPNTSGEALKLPITMEVAKPSSGEHIQFTLLNAVSASYD